MIAEQPHIIKHIVKHIAQHIARKFKGLLKLYCRAILDGIVQLMRSYTVANLEVSNSRNLSLGDIAPRFASAEDLSRKQLRHCRLIFYVFGLKDPAFYFLSASQDQGRSGNLVQGSPFV